MDAEQRGFLAPERSISRAKILIVDDTPANLRAFESVLSDLADVVLAASGQEALRHVLVQQEFAVILLDIRMPGLDGFETARQIRQRRKTRLTPIILMSAYDQTPVEASQAYLSGIIDYLFSPVQPDLLRSKVAALVELHQQNAKSRRDLEDLRSANQKLQGRLRGLEDFVSKLRMELGRIS